MFNVAGNKYRIVVWINYPYRVIYTRFIGTDRQYDAIKASIRKLAIDVSRLEAGLLKAGIKPLPITWTHACRVHDIAPSHPDPFDRY